LARHIERGTAEDAVKLDHGRRDTPRNIYRYHTEHSQTFDSPSSDMYDLRAILLLLSDYM